MKCLYGPKKGLYGHSLPRGSSRDLTIFVAPIPFAGTGRGVEIAGCERPSRNNPETQLDQTHVVWKCSVHCVIPTLIIPKSRKRDR